MKKINIYFKSIAIYILYILIISLITSSIYMFTNISSNTNSNILYILTILIFVFLSFHNSRISKDKGYIVGFKTSLVLLLTMFFLGLFFHSLLNIKKVLYYITLSSFSVVSGIIGANTKKK